MALSSSSNDKKVGRYRLLGELGQGGTAMVYLAVASGPAGFNKLLVLKKMKPQFATEPGFSEMFLTEARLAARLNHPNIVQTNEVLEDEGLPVIVMEYLEGKSLADIAIAARTEGAFTLQHHLVTISEALSGLHYSHELTDYKGRPLDLVHRDVTPHNVFVTFEGQVKILDYGIAKLSNSTVETETGIVKGKLRYIPPEQIVGEKVDRRSDIYSVGVMLWEAAVGEKMWRGLGDAAVMNRVLNEEVPSPRQHAPHVDERLERLIMKALSPDPGSRHQTAKELQEELDELRRALPDPVSPRELAPALEAMFDSERSKTRRLIQQRIADTPEDSGNSTGAAVSRSSPAHDSPTPPLLLLMGVVLAGVALWFLLADRSSQPVDSAAVPAPSAAVTSRPEPVEEGRTTRRVRITAYPHHATIQVDGTPQLSNPFSGRLPVSDEAPQVSVTAEGFKPLTASLPSHGDVDEVFHLDPLPTPTVQSDTARVPATSSQPSPATKRRPEPSPAAAPAQPDCDPPYRIDSRGVKRFKMECM